MANGAKSKREQTAKRAKTADGAYERVFPPVVKTEPVTKNTRARAGRAAHPEPQGEFRKINPLISGRPAARLTGRGPGRRWQLFTPAK